MIRTMTLNDVSEIIRIYAHYVTHTVVTFDTKVPSEKEMCERLQPIIRNCPAWVCVEEGRKGQGLAGILFEEGEKLCREWGFKNIRNDTHPDNRSMQRAVEKFGFERCGIIYIVGTEEDGSPRAAYQKVLND